MAKNAVRARSLEESQMNVELVRGEGLERGERLIMVDGVRWGQTLVSRHGVWGTRYRFQQYGGNTLNEPAICSRDSRRRKYSDEKPMPLEERVLAKARELIDNGQLRHPDIIRENNRREAERGRIRAQVAEKARRAQFRAKAMEALQTDDPDSEAIDRVVAAMEWAAVN